MNPDGSHRGSRITCMWCQNDVTWRWLLTQKLTVCEIGKAEEAGYIRGRRQEDQKGCNDRQRLDALYGFAQGVPLH